jgi:hypothetical protein
VLSTRLPINPPAGALVPSNHKPGGLNRIIADTVTVINPAAVPSGTELVFSYYGGGHLLYSSLVYTGSYTCSKGPPSAAP